MKTTISKRLILAAILGAALGCSSPDPAPEKVLLRGNPTKGMAYTRDQTEKVSGWLTVKADGNESKQPLVKEEHRVFEDEVLEVEAHHILKLKRKNVVWDLKRQTPGEAALTAVPRASVGRTIILLRTDLETEYEGGEGIPEDELRANILGTLEALVSPPADPIRVGAEWVVDGERAVEVFGGDNGGRALKIRSVSGTGKLVSIDAGQYANITVKLAVLGSFRSLLDVDVTLDMTANFRFDLGAGRPISFDAHADGKILGEVDRQGKPATYTGAFTFDTNARNKYR
jgi:hypothetical protein